MCVPLPCTPSWQRLELDLRARAMRRLRGVRSGWRDGGLRTMEALEARVLLSASIPTLVPPAAHWTFDEGTGVNATDTSGSGFNATLGAGATWTTTGNVGAHAVSFTGTTTGVVTATGPVVNTGASFTVSAWINLTNLSGYQTFVSIAGTSVAGFFLQLRGDTGTFAFTRLSADATGTPTYVAAPTAPVLNTWYHIVGVDDVAAGTLSLYVDGQSVGSTAYTSAWAANGDTLIGHGFYGGAQVDYVKGAIDDVQFFSSALSGDQVAALDQPAAYAFDEETGGTANDVSGHGNTLTLGGGATWTSGQVGTNALSLNGSATAFGTTPAAVVDTSQPFSVSAWVSLNALGTTQTFASIDGVNASGFALQYRADTSKFAFTRLGADSNAATVYHADATNSPVAGTWYNLIGVNDVTNSRLLLFVNGALQSTVTYTSGWQATGLTVVGAGKANGVRTEFTNGILDDVRFYNSALSSGVAAVIGSGGNSIITVNPAAIGPNVSPRLFGAFMEDINYGGEGGIYANNVRNSGFNDSSNALNAWSALTGTGVTAALTSDTTTGPTTALNKSGKLVITSGVSQMARAGIANSGYFGVAVAPSTTYTVDFYAKASGYTGPLTIALESNGGTTYASSTVASVSGAWTKYHVTLTTGAGAPVSSTNKFVIYTTNAAANGATIWFGATYLYPPSYNNSPAHLRVDLMQKLADLKPAIFRVPGGNYLEGNTYADRFNWSATIGPVENRAGHMNPWGYWSTDGMGLDEYLQMSELVGAEPVLAVYAGYTLNGTSDTGPTLAADVTDAINELHYVLDPVTTSWGQMRAANGHAAPYNINYVEVGNEDFFSSTYATRYPLFYDAIRAAFPQLKIIATSTSTGSRPYDVIDEHYYNTPQWFLSQGTRYDNTARTGTEVFVGEYAARTGGATGTLLAGLGDAAFLMGAERNSDLVTMTSYAPIWVNVNSYQWATNLIGFDNTSSFGSASYWAQVMLNNHKGTQVIGSTVAGGGALQTLVTRTGNNYYLTVINPLGTDANTKINLSGLTNVAATGTRITLSGASSSLVNSINNPTAIIPVTTSISGLAPSWNQVFPAYSLTIIEFNAYATPPSLVTPANASPSPVTGTTTHLSALGTDDGGEGALTYTWSTTGTPPAAVSFSVNGTNAAKETIATFNKAGTYNFSVLIKNAAGLTVASNVSVTVHQTVSGFAVTPGVMTVAKGASTPFAVYSTDQFGTPLVAQGGITWTLLAGSGSINSSGVYTAPANGTGVVTVKAVTAGGTAAFATVNILNQTAWYPANATSGMSLADSSGNGKDATLTGSAAFGAGVSGNALALSGGYASLPTGIVSTLNDFTIATWIKPSSLANWSRVFDFGTGATTNMFLTPSAGGSNNLRFAITTSGGNGEQRLNGPTLSLNAWTHVAVTLSGNTGTLYVNGAAVATNTGMTLHPSTLGSTTQNYLGKSQYNDPAYAGSIDDFRIIGRALSDAEVQALIAPSVVNIGSTGTSITTTSTMLTAVGADETVGESDLTYTWSTAGSPPAPVTFSDNGTNAAKKTTVTFSAPGTYNFLVTVSNPLGYTATSPISIQVNQAFTSVLVSPSSPTVLPGAMQTFTASARDQFGAAMPSQPAFTWAITTGEGSLDASTGGSVKYTAPATGGTATVRATATGIFGESAVTISPPPQLTGVVSRMPEGGTPYDLNLMGGSAVEFRDGGPKTLLFTFDHNVVLGGSFSLGLSSGAGNATVSGNQVIVQMSGAASRSTLTVHLNDVRDAATNAAGNYTFQLGVLAADFDQNGIVNAFDLNILAGHWQATVSDPHLGDVDGNGKVDAFDLNLLAANWQGVIAAPAPLATVATLSSLASATIVKPLTVSTSSTPIAQVNAVRIPLPATPAPASPVAPPAVTQPGPVNPSAHASEAPQKRRRDVATSRVSVLLSKMASPFRR